MQVQIFYILWIIAFRNSALCSTIRYSYWEMTVRTSDKNDAATHAAIHLTITDSRGISQDVLLGNNHRRGSVQELFIPLTIGDPVALQLFLSLNKTDKWLLEEIVFVNINTNSRLTFKCGCWIPSSGSKTLGILTANTTTPARTTTMMKSTTPSVTTSTETSLKTTTETDSMTSTTATSGPSFTSTTETALETTVTESTTTNVHNNAISTSEYPCHCACAPSPDLSVLIMTEPELLKVVESLKNELKTDKTKLSSTTRKLTSARDDRPSAKAAGYVGCLILTTIGVMLVIADFPLYVEHFKILKRNLQRR